MSEKWIEAYWKHVAEGYVFEDDLKDNERVNNDNETFAIFAFNGCIL